MTEHKFNTEHAEKYGLNEAIILQNIIFWIATNKSNNTHEHKVVDGDFDGELRTWTYNSVKSFSTIFNYLTPKQIRTALDKLNEKGVLLKGNYNTNKTERTNWYALCDESEFIPKRFLKGKSDLPLKAEPIAPQGKSIYTDTNHTDKNLTYISDEQLPVDKVSVKLYEQSIDGNCTLPILDSTEPIYDVKAKETQPKAKDKKPSKYDSNPERFKFINEKTKAWNLTASDDIKIRASNKNTWVISSLYDNFGAEQAEIIFNHVMSKGNYRQPYGLISTKNVQDALASYQDPNNEEPRFLNEEWKTMERFSRPNYLEPFVAEFNTEEALYASWEWYYKGKGLEGVEIVKAVREKIKEINHPRFNKY
jgi:hypothetical protein